MVALRDLHRRLHSRDNDDLINRDVSSDEYDMDEIDEAENKNENKKDSLTSEESNSETEKKPFDKKEGDFSKDDFIAKDPSGPPSNEKIDLGKVEGGSFWERFVQNKFKVAGAIALLLLLVIVGIIGYVRYKQGSFKPENVLVEVQGDAEIRSGDEFKYKFLVENDNRASLEDVVLKVIYPEELIPTKMSFTREGPDGVFYIDVGKIKAFETKDFELTFKVFSPHGNQPYLNTELSYQPDNFSSEFVKKDNHLVNIQGSVVNFSLISQKEGASGELLKFIGVLTNNTVKDFDDLVLEMVYPDGFSFDGSGLEVLDKQDEVFKIPKLKSGEKMEVEILGTFLGQIDSIKKMVGKVGFLNEDASLSEISIAEEAVKIIPARVTLIQSVVSGADTEKLTTRTGNNVKYRVDFKNNSSSPLLDLVLKGKIEGSLVDQNSVRAKGGYYNQETKEIVWLASDVPELKELNPGEGGFVEFDYEVRDDLVPENEENQILVTQARISSLNIDTNLPESKEINSGDKELKVKTDLDLLVSGSFGEGAFKNSGPIPVQVGEETTFTVKVSLKNSFNKISNPNLIIRLPSGIKWKDSFHRSSGDVSFNDRTNELKWEMNQLNSKVGYKNPTEELIFQIGVTPQNDQSSGRIVLVNEVDFRGFEEFVEEDIFNKTRDFKLGSISDYDF